MSDSQSSATNASFNKLEVYSDLRMYDAAARATLVSELVGQSGVSFYQLAGSNSIASGAGGQAVTTYAAPAKGGITNAAFNATTGVFTAPQTGRYNFSVSTTWAATGAAGSQLTVGFKGTNVGGGTFTLDQKAVRFTQGTTTTEVCNLTTGPLALTLGDTIYVYAQQATGGPIAATSTTFSGGLQPLS